MLFRLLSESARHTLLYFTWGNPLRYFSAAGTSQRSLRAATKTKTLRCSIPAPFVGTTGTHSHSSRFQLRWPSVEAWPLPDGVDLEKVHTHAQTPRAPSRGLYVMECGRGAISTRFRTIGHAVLPHNSSAHGVRSAVPVKTC